MQREHRKKRERSEAAPLRKEILPLSPVKNGDPEQPLAAVDLHA
ncbi:hypothetical protein [Paenibacillus dauci]|nr:hypothetical protein [Paenibacillus dauci]